MIEIEPMESAVSDKTLRLVALFCGQHVKDKLLYEVPYGSHDRTVRTAAPVFQRRHILGNWFSRHPRHLKDHGGEA